MTRYVGLDIWIVVLRGVFKSALREHASFIPDSRIPARRVLNLRLTLSSTVGHLRRIAAIAVVVVVFGCCLLSLRSDFVRLSFGILGRSWGVVLLATTLSLSNYALRIARWRIYLSRLGHSLTVEFSALTYIAGFAFTMSPGKLGEVARARYYMAVGVPARDVVAAFGVERLMDLLSILALSALILSVLPDYAYLIWAVALFIAGSIGLLCLPHRRRERVIESSHYLPHLIARLTGGAASAIASSRPLLAPSAITFGLLIALVAWGLEGVGLGVLSSTFPSAHLPISLAIGIYGVSTLVGALSFLPGGLGSTEAVMTTLLVKNGYPLSDALTVTLACRFITLWLSVCLGWIAIAVLRRRSVQATVTQC